MSDSGRWVYITLIFIDSYLTEVSHYFGKMHMINESLSQIPYAVIFCLSPLTLFRITFNSISFKL